MNVVALTLAAAVLLVASFAQAQPHVQDELNRGKVALTLKRFDEAAGRFGELAAAGNAEAQFYMGRLTISPRRSA